MLIRFENIRQTLGKIYLVSAESACFVSTLQWNVLDRNNLHKALIVRVMWQKRALAGVRLCSTEQQVSFYIDTCIKLNINEVKIVTDCNYSRIRSALQYVENYVDTFS